MKPKILLINPPIYDFAAYDFWLKPYGMLSIAGFLRGKADFTLFDYLDRVHPFVAENEELKSDLWGRGRFYEQKVPLPPCLEHIPRFFRRFGLPRQFFIDFLKNNPPADFVLIQTMMTYWYPGIKEVIEDIRNCWPDTKIILGGNYVTVCPDHAKTLGADSLVTGIELEPLWQYLNLEPDLTQPAAWELYPKLNTGVLKLTQGCPFNCTYCSVPKIYREFVPRSLERSIAELELLVKLGAQNIAFYDDALVFNPELVFIPFLETVLNRGIKVEPHTLKGATPPHTSAKPAEASSFAKASEDYPFRIHPRLNNRGFLQRRANFHTPNALNARFITKDLADLMVRAGFKTFYLGFESTSQDWQKQTGSKVYSEELSQAVQNLINAGANPLEITAYQILGHPHSDLQQIEQSMYFVNSLGIRGMLADFSPIPGTPDGELCRKQVNLDEPLMHNKTAFPIILLGNDEVNRLKDLQRKLNRLVGKAKPD